MDFERIRARYAGKASQEWDRLCSTPITRIEYLITTDCLERYLPASGLILDVGSGPGRYAIDLACKGYRVVMFDLLREMLCLGRQKVTERHLQDKVGLIQGNMVAIPCRDNCFDAVISLGAPLSHITDEQARARAVVEVARVVKPGGQVFLTGMSRLACYRSMVFWLKDHPEFFDQMKTAGERARGIVDGSQVWYTFEPGELEDFTAGAGLQVIERVGCEGLANHLPLEILEQVEADGRYWLAWKEILLETCNEPSIIGLSNHLLVVARKPSRTLSGG
jgi:ubiquinone/menaquinone biosynthesis C-methylase UbiE